MSTWIGPCKIDNIKDRTISIVHEEHSEPLKITLTDDLSEPIWDIINKYYEDQTELAVTWTNGDFVFQELISFGGKMENDIHQKLIAAFWKEKK